MPTFMYRAKRGPTDTVEGELNAQHRQEAVARIDALGLSPVWVHEKSEVEDGRSWTSGRGVRGRDVNIFTRQLASMIKSGVSILRALMTIRSQTANRRLQTIVGEIEDSIRDGSMLSEALARYPRLFPDLYLNLVRSGEAGGILDSILVRLAEAREKEEEVRRKVQAALAYPALMLAMGLLTVVVMLVFLLPRITSLFPDTTVLPGPTRALLALSEGVTTYWYIGLAAVLLLYAMVRQATSHARGRAAMHGAVLGIPVVGGFVRDADLARFSRTLSLLVQTGIPIDRGLDLAARTVANAVLHDEIVAARRETVSQGTGVAAALGAARHVPPYVVNMIAVGEETGSLDEALAEVASYYEREVDLMTRVVTSLLEPILILLVGGVIGFIVFAMLLPVFELGQAIG